MSRYIDADHLKKWLLARWEEIDPKSENPFKMADIFNQIDYGEPSIDIVRCKECKHSSINENHPLKPLICGLTRMCGTTPDNWFCADGEPKGE